MHTINNLAKILVANASAASLFSVEHSWESDGLKLSLTKIQDFSHKESREKTSDFISDRPGSRQVPGNVGGTYEYKNSPKDVEAELFAKILAKTLYSEMYNEANLQHGEKLLVIAPAGFYNFFMKHWHYHAPIIEHLAKDYTKFTLKDLTAKLHEYFTT